METWGQKSLPFGKHQRKPYADVVSQDPSYARWALSQDNPSGPLEDFISYLKAAGFTEGKKRDGRLPRGSRAPTQPQFQTTRQSLSRPSPSSLHDSFISPPSTAVTPFDDLELQIDQLEPPGRTATEAVRASSTFVTPEPYTSSSGWSSSPPLSTSTSALTALSPDQSLDEVVLQLVSPTHFTILVRSRGKLSSFLPQHLYSVVSPLRDATSSITAPRSWTTVFHASRYPEIVRVLTTDVGAKSFEPIPNFVLLAFKDFRPYVSHSVLMHRRSANILTGCISPRTASKQQQLEVLLGPTLAEGLKPFQLEGISFGLSRNGRCLLGDEMGLGKTLQALGIAAIFRDEWPCLIIAPSSIRFQWRDQVMTWLGHLVKPYEVTVVRTGKDALDPSLHKVIIVSYDLIKNTKFHLNYHIVICDESHYLKNLTSQRTTIILPLIQRARRAVLLSGTPALNRPTELYPQLSALIPRFASAKEFAKRYADVKINPWSQKPEYAGYRLTEELHTLLHHTVMIRRLKRDVQSQLPPKMRSKIPVECSAKELAEIKTLMETHHIKTHGAANLESIFQAVHCSDPEEGCSNKTSEAPTISREAARNVIGQLFLLSGRGKIAAAAEHVLYLIECGAKVLLFAHHHDVMDGLELRVRQKKINYVRVDGSVRETDREERIKKFQENDQYRVAILSMTACSHGLNLTAAGTVVFAELYWVPGVVVQAEDRSHRLGTTYASIDIHYLIAEGTIDELMWKILQNKWSGVTSTLDGRLEHYATDAYQAPLPSGGTTSHQKTPPYNASSGLKQATLSRFLTSSQSDSESQAHRHFSKTKDDTTPARFMPVVDDLPSKGKRHRFCDAGYGTDNDQSDDDDQQEPKLRHGSAAFQSSMQTPTSVTALRQLFRKEDAEKRRRMLME